MRYRLVVWLLAPLAVVAAGFLYIQGPPSQRKPPYDEKPIIAYMLSHPQLYDRKTVTVYGLVIEASAGGKKVLLQDVSQMPLSVQVAVPYRVAKGDQIVVEGVFHAGGEARPMLKAGKITHTKVLGGGGCC